jgi:spermidine/putrescine-binding protein
VGDLTVKGLQVHYFKNKNDDFVTATSVKQAEGKNYGVRYNFGEFTVGANKKVYNAEGTATVAEISEKAYAAAYAITPTLSIGVIKATADRSNTADAVEQTMKAINIGYALGPVDLSVGYANNENGANVNGADSDVFMARLIGKF